MLPYVIDFADDGQFLIIVEELISPLKDLPQWAEYAVHYHASSLGIIANIKSEALNYDFGALSAALQAVLQEFRPGATRSIEFSHSDLSIKIMTASLGALILIISLKADRFYSTVFTFEMHMEQEDAKRLIREIDVLLTGTSSQRSP